MRFLKVTVAFGVAAVLSMASPSFAQTTEETIEMAYACAQGDIGTCQALYPRISTECRQGNEAACAAAQEIQQMLRGGQQGSRPAPWANGGGQGIPDLNEGGPRLGFDPNQPLPCRFQAGATSMISGNLPLVACSRLIGASGGRGMWGQNQVQVDQNAMVYLNGQALGRARNLSGTYGSLEQRCTQQFDQAACSQWQRQTQQGIDQYGRMYPQGWNR